MMRNHEAQWPSALRAPEARDGATRHAAVAPHGVASPMVKYRVDAEVRIEDGPWEVYRSERESTSGQIPSVEDVSRGIREAIARDHGTSLDAVGLRAVRLTPHE
jgi:hypothetical protein